MPYSSTLMGKSTREVMTILGITEPTLRNWILTGKIKPEIHPIGTRNYYDFSEEEIERVKKLMAKKWKQGKSKLQS
jgi:predicted site-specific integrase-resolvase